MATVEENHGESQTIIQALRAKIPNLSEELESHLAHEIDDNLTRGMSPEEARRLAYVKLGNPQRIRDEVWETNRIGWLEDIGRDLRYAARTLAKAPSFTLVALLVMALGIGANTAIYSFLDSLLLRSLPVSDPSSLVILNWHTKARRRDTVMQSMSGYVGSDPRLGDVSGIFPYTAFENFQNNALPAKNANLLRRIRLLPHARSPQCECERQRPGRERQGRTGFRRLLSRAAGSPAAGRLILPDDDRVGAAPVVVASHASPRNILATRPTLSDNRFSSTTSPFTIAGVAPPGIFRR